MRKRKLYILLMVVALIMLGCSKEDDKENNSNNSSWQQEQVSENDDKNDVGNNTESDDEKADVNEEKEPVGNESSDNDNREKDEKKDEISDNKEDNNENYPEGNKGEIGVNDSENNDDESKDNVNTGSDKSDKVDDGSLIPEDTVDKEKVDVEITVTDDGEVVIEKGEKGSKESIVAGLDYPSEFDKKDLADADIVFVKIDENETPDIIVSSGEDTSMIWIYDDEKEEYVYSHEMSKVTQEGKVELEGSWMSEGVQLDVVKNSDLYSVIISKNIEGVEMTEWIYECKLSKSNSLECSKKGCKTVVKFEEGGTVSSIEEQYSDGSAKFYIEGKNLYWKDEKENSAEILEFVKTN